MPRHVQALRGVLAFADRMPYHYRSETTRSPMSLPSHTALVEFSTSHLECLQTQIQFLKAGGSRVELVLSAAARDRASHLRGADRIHHIRVQNGIRGRWNAAADLRRILAESGARVVVFNTAEGNHVRDFLLMAPRGIVYAGILHHTGKLQRSFTQRLISRHIRRYYVLMDYLLPPAADVPHLRFASFSALARPALPPDGPVKPPDQLWLCIPGEIEFRRRDYPGLADALRTTPPDPAIRFILLGSANTPDGARFEQSIRETGYREQFVFFSGFVRQQEFTGYLSQCDAVLPLIHPGVRLYDEYRHRQVSGAFTQALSYQLPLLLDRSWAGEVDFDTISLFYEQPALLSTLNRLTLDRRDLEDVRERLVAATKFSVAVQQQRYLDLLDITHP